MYWVAQNCSAWRPLLGAHIATGYIPLLAVSLHRHRSLCSAQLGQLPVTPTQTHNSCQRWYGSGKDHRLSEPFLTVHRDCLAARLHIKQLAPPQCGRSAGSPILSRRSGSALWRSSGGIGPLWKPGTMRGSGSSQGWLVVHARTMRGSGLSQSLHHGGEWWGWWGFGRGVATRVWSMCGGWVGV
eukprot:354454-Chlamydomonas_euryale.AAC.1